MPTPLGDAWQDVWQDVWADVWAATGGAPDTEAPVGTITSPLDGATVSGTINIVGLFTDNVGVTDGNLVTDGLSGLPTGQSGGSFTIAVDTTALANGTHTFQIDARDAADNRGYSQIITLTVSNYPVPPPLPPGGGAGLYPLARRRRRR